MRAKNVALALVATAAAVTIATASFDRETFDEDVVALVNRCRDDAGVPRVAWDPDLARGCEAFVRRGSFGHTTGGDYAEVLAQIPSGHDPYAYALQVMYWGEKAEFVRQGGSCQKPEGGCSALRGFVRQEMWQTPGCGHYCALIDPSLRRVGAAYARRCDGCKPGSGLVCIRLV